MKTKKTIPVSRTFSRADLLRLREGYQAKLETIDQTLSLLDDLVESPTTARRASRGAKAPTKKAAPVARRRRGQVTQRELAEKAMKRFQVGFTLSQVMQEMRKDGPVNGKSLAALFSEMKKKGELRVIRPGSGNKPSLLRRVAR
jgi:hypothetical protein